MLEYLVEFIGTFFFLSVIIITNNPLAVGLALSSMVWFGSKVSGGHFNPAVNLMMLLNKKINMTQFIGQTLAQFVGAVAAYCYYKQIKK